MQPVSGTVADVEGGHDKDHSGEPLVDHHQSVVLEACQGGQKVIFYNQQVDGWKVSKSNLAHSFCNDVLLRKVVNVFGLHKAEHGVDGHKNAIDKYQTGLVVNRFLSDGDVEVEGRVEDVDPLDEGEVALILMRGLVSFGPDPHGNPMQKDPIDHQGADQDTVVEPLEAVGPILLHVVL